MNDTGLCAPESIETLLLQQRQLLRGARNVQMFPCGTPELPLPDGCHWHENFRGVFHFRPESISFFKIDELSEQGRENEFLLLGPFSKYDISSRLQNGEMSTCITEYVSGFELRCAIGTNGTIDQQRRYFEETKESDGLIIIGECPDRVKRWLAANDEQKQRSINYG